MAAPIWLRVGGVPATEIAAHTPPTWEMGADGGCLSASWAFSLSMRAQHTALRVRSLVEIMYGPLPVYTGLLTEPDRTTWECHAMGLSSSLRDFLALDGTGATTRNIATAVTEAAVRGWRGTNPTPVAGIATGDATGNPVSAGTLLDDYAAQTGQRWGVGGSGRLYMRPDPTTATLMTAPGTAAFAPTSENAPGRLAGRYFDGSAYLTAFVGATEPEEVVDLADRGTLTLAEAQAILSGMLALQGATGWTNAVTLHREQLMTTGGNPANLVANHSGKMLRAHGFTSNAVTPTPWQNVVIGKTRHTAGEEVITVEPVNSAPRTFTDVIAAR